MCPVSLVPFCSGTGSAHLRMGNKGCKLGGRLPGGWPVRKVAPHWLYPKGHQSHPIPTQLLLVAESLMVFFLPYPLHPKL